MGYFAGITDAIFKKDGNGNVVFYPWGVFGRGRVFSDPVKAGQIRRFVYLYYVVSLPTAIVLTVLHAWLLLVISWLLLLAWYIIQSRTLLAGTPFSDERLGVKEAYFNSSASHNRVTLWFVFLSSVLFVAAGVWITASAHSTSQVLLGLGAIVLFGAAGAAIGYMLKVKPN